MSTHMNARLAIVVNSYPSLSESFLVNKVEGLRQRGIDVTVLAHSRRSDTKHFAKRLGQRPLSYVRYSPIAGGLERLPLSVAALAWRRPRVAARLWRASRARYGPGRRAAKAWVRALPLALGRYDLIHFEYSGLAVSYLDALPLLAPAKLIASCRGTAELVVPRVRHERAAQLREVFAIVDRVHCVSADMLRTVEEYGLASGKGFVNHPAVDAERFRRRCPYPENRLGPYRLVSIGRLHWVKGLDWALLAVRLLLDEGHDVYYDIVGGGPEEERLRFTIHALGLDGRVRLRGPEPADRVRDALEMADVYLSPSLSEGMSNAVLEAMAMAIPVVSTDVGGMPEAIHDGCEGLLVPPRDAAALSEKVALLLCDSQRRRRMGLAGRRQVERNFDLARQLDRFVAAYHDLLR
jgi:colanic acid/amylovoran biosynthesis glycosyltransferase